MEPGALVTLDIEKPAVGGRMLARVNGQVVLVWGAIPGERVRARIERIGRGVVYAETADVLDASPDRRDAGPDWRCGGNVYAHVTYDRQVRMKGEIIRETLGRIGRLPLAEPPIVLASPERGYRMRARLHIGNGRLGYFREGTHELCDPAITGQLLPSTLAWIADAERYIENERVKGLISVEFIENLRGDERACHVEFERGSEPPSSELLAGSRWVGDTLQARHDDPSSALHIRRSARAFFQANRFLLEHLVQHVASLVRGGPVVDLYAGVGLFGLALAAAGIDEVTLVEGDPVGEEDLRANAVPFGSRVRIERRSVETFLAHPLNGSNRSACTFIVDPPRTGMSRGAMAGIVHTRPARIVYVSCDIATLARDTRTLLDAGYSLEGLTGLDLFPNTAHVESVAEFVHR